MSFDWNRLSTLDRAIAGCAAVAFIAAFLPWYGATAGPFSVSVSGWSAGFSAWAGSLLLVAAGVLVVLRRSGVSLKLGDVDPSVIVAAVAGLGLLLVIIRWISFPRYHGADVGARYGIYIALIVGIVEVAAAAKELRASGGRAHGSTDPPLAAPAAADPMPPADPAPEPPPEAPAVTEE